MSITWINLGFVVAGAGLFGFAMYRIGRISKHVDKADKE